MEKKDFFGTGDLKAVDTKGIEEKIEKLHDLFVGLNDQIKEIKEYLGMQRGPIESKLVNGYTGEKVILGEENNSEEYSVEERIRAIELALKISYPAKVKDATVLSIKRR